MAELRVPMLQPIQILRYELEISDCPWMNQTPGVCKEPEHQNTEFL